MKKILKNQDGIALSFVVMTLLVLFILTSIVASIAQTNIKQASAQDKGLQAYYTARSGAEMAFEALTDTRNASTLFSDLKASAVSSGSSKTDKVPVSLPDGMGTAEVEVLYKKTKNVEEVVEIHSAGTYSGITRSVILKVYFDIDTTTNKSSLKEIVWSK